MNYYSKEEKAMWLEDWRQSGKNPWSYARDNGLIPQTFTSWTKQEKRAIQPFVEVSTEVFKTSRSVQELILEKGGLTFRIPMEAVIGELRTIITKLGETI